MQLDEGFYLKLNNIAKLRVNLKVFHICVFPIVCVPFSLSIFFHKAQDWAVLSLSLMHRKAQAFVGLKNELGLTPCKE